jgi:hypothetical protein
VATGRTIFQGEFGEILIPDILTFLDMIGKTGVLEVQRGDDRKRIFWERGEIAYADSTAHGEVIGEYLCRNGWITPAALSEAQDAGMKEDELVKSLLRKGALEPSVLPRAVKLLVLDIVYSLFEWRDGGFRFVLSAEPYSEKVVLKTSVSNIIMEGTRRLDEWQRIRETFPSDDTYALPAREAPDTVVKLPPIEQDVLAQVDGHRTVADIVRLVEHDQFSVLNALLTLMGAGLVSPSTTPAPARPVVPHGSGNGISDDRRAHAAQILSAFNNIFAGIRERIASVKGASGIEQFAATLHKSSFQKSGIFEGVTFGPDGRIGAEAVIANLAQVPDEERLSRLKGTLDRLLAQQVLQLDTSYPADEKKAISDLIAHEKARLQAE